jgi:Protein kinase domain
MISELDTRYELTTRLGSGPTGTVWKAVSRTTGNPFAIKVLHPRLTADPQVVERFAQERAVLTAVVHPVLVRVHEVLTEDDAVALVRDFIPGTDLRNPRDQDPPITARHALILAAQVAEALAVSHQAGVVHGGLKPANLIVSRARVWLTDCRVALLALGDPDAANVAGGGHAAPECVSGEPVGPAADVYALGSVLHETLDWCTGGETADLPRALRDLLTACRESDPAARPPTAEVARCLRSVRDGHSLSAAAAAALPPPTGPGLAAPGPRRGDGPEGEHAPEAAAPVSPSGRPRWGRRDLERWRRNPRPWTPAEPSKPAPKARSGSAAHARRTRDRARGSRRHRRLMAGVVSGAVLVACMLGVVARNSGLTGDGVATPVPAGQPADGKNRARTPVGPGTAQPSRPVPPGDQSLAGATRFASEWFSALNEAVSSGNTSRLDARSAAGCAACARARQVVRDARSDGGTLRGGTYAVRSVRADSFWSASHPVLQVVFDRSPRSSLTAAGAVRSALPGATFATCQMVLTWGPQGWRVREVLAGTSIA